jgi:uncharacterized peroxidase-related enzyme
MTSHRGTLFPALRWQPWLEPPPPPDIQPGSTAKTPGKWSPFYLTLLHEPRTLAERTQLYNAIMSGPGALGRVERELAALAVSVANGCEYCGSVHGRRLVGLTKETETAAILVEKGPSALEDPRLRSIAVFAAKMTPTPPEAADTDIAHLREVGLSEAEIADLVAVVAVFAWANRLMQTLGEPCAP